MSNPTRSGRVRGAVLMVMVGAAALSGCGDPEQGAAAPAASELSSSQQAPPGTPVTLTARTPDGTRPTPETMHATQQIIQWRAEGMQLTGTSVEITDNAVVITVPGDDGAKARTLGQTGRLNMRPVLFAAPPMGSGPVVTDAMAAKISRQSVDPATQQQALTELNCGTTDPLRSNDDPLLPLVTCSTDGTEVMVLGPAILDNDAVDGAESQFIPQNAGHVVEVTFTADGRDAFSSYTAENVGNRFAFVVDTRVVSAPQMMEAIKGGSTQIAGNFTADSADELANSLRFGALPVTFAER
ncbi:preprotein translocase subunit SecD [Nocardia sp. NPDC059180]|uniref:preprotein translocase subunit SecD n=1 Tax=Nocardia sp. NPDC059180 TaxID=3346761 RepID=UPI0036821FB9